jgi:hypothetical protein
MSDTLPLDTSILWRDRPIEEQGAEAQRRLTAVHLWILSKPLPATGKAPEDDDKTREV